MNDPGRWLAGLGGGSGGVAVEGLVPVAGYQREGRPPEEVSVMEKAQAYGAHAVFFEAPRGNRPQSAQAFIFLSDGPAEDAKFAELHKRIWSWGGVPLLYRKLPGLVQLFRCAHQPDFVSPTGGLVCKPISTLKLAADISAREVWWDAARLRNGTLWDDPAICRKLLSAERSAHKGLLDAVMRLSADLNNEGVLKKHLRRKLLILSLLVAYLEERGVFPEDYFGRFRKGARRFFEVLANGKALVALFEHLEERFNGNVFVLSALDREWLRASNQLVRFARLVEAHEEPTGQLTLWQLYSFKDLPVELISHIYQQFVKDSDSSVYTPPFLVRLILEEALSWERLDRLQKCDEVILDPSCGSGVFLVEAYKRLVLHWRSRNHWKRPTVGVLKRLLNKLRGIDIEPGAIELAAFSLCLALCDALEPEEIRSSIKLFPPLDGNTLHRSCFFEAKEKRLLREPVGVVVGNPPFESRLTTPGAERSYAEYHQTYGSLPDKQLAYLFLHEAMSAVTPGGVLAMLQQYSFLYNQQSLPFRRQFFASSKVREILDFVSVRGLFKKGGADTKVVVVVAEAGSPRSDDKVLHAVFRRSGRVEAEQGFDIDYYDMHWLPQRVVERNDGVWRADLLGGGRVLSLIDRLREYRTLGDYAKERGWDYGEGFIEGRQGVSRPAQHIIGKPLLPSEALDEHGVDASKIGIAPRKQIEGPRSVKRFTPPLLLVREHMDLAHARWDDYLTYKNKIVGFAATHDDRAALDAIDNWLTIEAPALRAFVAAISVRLFTQKATTLSEADILAIPYPESGNLDLSENERVMIADIVGYQRDLIRLGDDSVVMNSSAADALGVFSDVFCRQINTVYGARPIRPLPHQSWAGAACQPFVFGDGTVDWSGADELQARLNSIVHEQTDPALHVTRVTRLYDGPFLFLLKPDRLRYWTRSVALRDADETLSDLRGQGF